MNDHILRKLCLIEALFAETLVRDAEDILFILRYLLQAI